MSAKTRQTARVSEELSSGRSNVEEFDLANQDFLDEESESLQDFVTNMKTLQLLSTPFSSSLREERQKRQQANCSGYVLDNECDCFLQNSRVGIPLQQVCVAFFPFSQFFFLKKGGMMIVYVFLIWFFHHPKGFFLIKLRSPSLKFECYQLNAVSHFFLSTVY